MTPLASPFESRRVLLCAPLPPEFDRESGSRRIYHLLEMLRAGGWSVTFVCENAPANSPHVRHLRQMGVPTFVGFDGHTADLVSAADFNLAIFAFWYLADRHVDLVRRLSPTTHVVVETVDLHWLRKARRVLGAGGEHPGKLDDTYGSEMVAELNTYARADGVLTVSEKEAGLINDLVGDRGLAHAVPDYDDAAAGEAPFEERRGIVFIGNFRHPPNLDALEHLCEDILPLLPRAVRQEHPVYVVGNGPGERVHELADACENVRVVGWVPSVVPYLHAARVSVVPLRYGAGTKRKLIESLLAGTPSVSTPVGIEGIDVADERHLLLGEDAPGFAAATERLLTDEDLWYRLSEEGRAKMKERHDVSAARVRFKKALDAIMDRPVEAHSVEEGSGIAWSAPDGPLERIRDAVRASLPPDARVLVVSKGDPELLDLPGCRAAHFPQNGDGQYIGYHPRDSRHAVRHLDEQRNDADYLLFPSTSLWWLDYYGGFASHVEKRFERVWSDSACAIFDLDPAGNGRRPEGGRDDAGAQSAPRSGSRSKKAAGRSAPTVTSSAVGATS